MIYRCYLSETADRLAHAPTHCKEKSTDSQDVNVFVNRRLYASFFDLINSTKINESNRSKWLKSLMDLMKTAQ